jgi:hypothetical protein
METISLDKQTPSTTEPSMHHPQQATPPRRRRLALIWLLALLLAVTFTASACGGVIEDGTAGDDWEWVWGDECFDQQDPSCVVYEEQAEPGTRSATRRYRRRRYRVRRKRR